MQVERCHSGGGIYVVKRNTVLLGYDGCGRFCRGSKGNEAKHKCITKAKLLLVPELKIR